MSALCGLILLNLMLAWVGWIVLAGWETARFLRRTSRVDLLGLLALTVLALGLRLAAPAVQHDLNPRSDDVFMDWRSIQWIYTHGLCALMRIVRATGITVDDQTIFHTVALFGALTVPALAVLVRQLGGGRVAAYTTGLVLAMLGLHVRYSHTDAPQIVTACLLTVAAIALSATPQGPRWSHVALAGLSLGLAAAMRPEAIVASGFVWLWSLAATSGWTAGRRVAAMGLALLVALPDVGMVSLVGRDLATQHSLAEFGQGPLAYGLRHYAAWNPAFVPTALGVLIWPSLIGRAGLRRSVATLLLLLALGATFGPPVWSLGAAPTWCLARHQLPALTWAVLLMGLGAEAIADTIAAWTPRAVSRFAAVTLVLATTAITSTTLKDAYARFTYAEEYAFVRANLPLIPERCHVATYVPVYDEGLFLRVGLTALGLEHTWGALEDPIDPAGCNYYYRAALCSVSTPDFTPPEDRCSAFERSWTLTPVAEASIVARGWLWEVYPTSSVRVGYYRLTPKP